MESVVIIENKNTGSYYKDFIKNYDDLETFNYLCKMLMWNDNRVIKHNMQKLAIVLNNLKIKKGGQNNGNIF